MFNCYKVYLNNRLYAIVKDCDAAELLVDLHKSAYNHLNIDYTYEGSYIPDVAF